MKKSSSVNLLIVLSYVIVSLALQLFFPWYIIVICALIAAYFMPLHPFRVIIIFSFLGFVMWGLTAFYIDSDSEGVLSTRIGTLFGNQRPATLIFITGVVAAISSGLGAWCGSQLRVYFQGE